MSCPRGGGEGGGCSPTLFRSQFLKLLLQKQQFSDKLKDLVMKHPREKQTYSKQHENDLLKSSKYLWL